MMVPQQLVSGANGLGGSDEDIRVRFATRNV